MMTTVHKLTKKTFKKCSRKENNHYYQNFKTKITSVSRRSRSPEKGETTWHLFTVKCYTWKSSVEEREAQRLVIAFKDNHTWIIESFTHNTQDKIHHQRLKQGLKYKICNWRIYQVQSEELQCKIIYTRMLCNNN